MTTLRVADEVSSLVIDIGSKKIRIGYSGDERPALILPTTFLKRGKDEYLFGDSPLWKRRFDTDEWEWKECISSSGIDDSEGLKRLLKYCFEDVLQVSPKEYPILLVDNSAHFEKTDGDSLREGLISIFFDYFEVPALFLGRAPVLAAFASGKHTGLVIDLGHEAARVSAVYEGYMIQKRRLTIPTTNTATTTEETGISPIQSDPRLGGRHGNVEVEAMLHNDFDIERPLLVRSQIKEKTAVPLGEKASFKLFDDFPPASSGFSEDFLDYQRQEVLSDVKETLMAISELPFSIKDLSIRPSQFYELPDGSNRQFGLERYRLGERLFYPEKYTFTTMMEDNTPNEDEEDEEDEPSTVPSSGLINLVANCLEACDVELKGPLVSSVILTGPASVVTGLSERLLYELNRNCAFGRIKIVSPSPHERCNGAWIGGSILGSISSFQSMWISREEYLSNGPSFVEKKCP